jgi:maltose alpha-D-glucosyltransferase/alpha-amylase
VNLHPPLTAWLERALPERLLEFLPPRRWFGAKARPIAGIDVEDLAWLPGGRPCALAVVGVRFAAGGGRDRYSVVLAFVREPDGLPVVGRIDERGDTTWVVEAATDAGAARALLGGFAPASEQEYPMLHGGTLRYGDAGETTVRALADAFDREGVRAVGAEQSNTSLRLDRSLAFKLFRRLEDGENPELEMGRFLATRTPFRAMPMLRGSLTYVPARGESATVGVLQDWIESDGDGWQYVTRLLAEPDGARRVLRDLHALGVTTADFHAALAADPTLSTFAPEPVTPADVEGWRTSLLEGASRTFRLVEQGLPAWPDEARREAKAVLALQSRVATLAQALDLRAAEARLLKIRIHGDYHLGQTLKTDTGFSLIDFEGEPARPLGQRRLKQCALKDVAGMIRSFDYAVETVRPARSEAAAAAGDVRRLRQAFLDGYVSSVPSRRPTFLPDDPSALDTWIACFETEKALYEVEYEINNRPGWVRIPLAGIRGILGDVPGR